MVAAAATTFINLTPFSITTFANSGGTALRMIGDIRVETSGAGADHIDLDVGIGVITSEAFLLGVGPDPATDLTQDWYYWKHLDSHLPGNLSDSMNQGMIDFDIRTSRRLRQGYFLALILQKGITSSVINLSVGIRILWRMQP